jgi:hypothetical protein
MTKIEISKKLYAKKYYQKHKKEHKKYYKKYNKKNKWYYKELHLRNRYGLTVQDYNILAKKQKHCCAICKEKKRFSVDHNHTTGKVRGLLCYKCNTLMHLVDNPKLLRKAIDYANRN